MNIIVRGKGHIPYTIREHERLENANGKYLYVNSKQETPKIPSPFVDGFKKQLLKRRTFAELKAAKLLRENFGDKYRITEQKIVKVKLKQWVRYLDPKTYMDIITDYVDVGKKRYIADLFIEKLRIIVELDGGIHNKTMNRDTERDMGLMKRNLVVRFPNEIVLHHEKSFIETMKKIIADRELQLSTKLI